jgi:putative ABC transport system substrate-binding protein
MVGTNDPVAAGLVGNLARPGGNITGTAAVIHSAVGKQMELIRQMLPHTARLWVVWDPGNAAFHQQSLGEALIAGTRLRILVRPVEAHSREELERILSVSAPERPDAILALQSPIITADRERLAEAAIANRMPMFSGNPQYAEAGFLATYGPSLDVLGRRAATYLDKILKGTKPGDMAIELPTKYDLIINAKTAKALGLAIPQSVLQRADEVIR